MTFDELGIPFPLFKAPVDDCAHLPRRGTLSTVRGEQSPLFSRQRHFKRSSAGPAPA